jgi:ParB-like chromosome segregation protein Spo0J
MNIEWIDINEIHEYPGNPRNNESAVETTAWSISEYGWRQPIVVDSKNVIVAGHTRLRAAKLLNMKKCPVLVANGLSEAQAKAYRIADNKTGEIATWDEQSLIMELTGLKNTGFDLELTGFDEDYLTGPCFEPGTEDDQGKLDELSPIIVTCQGCGKEFDVRKQG